MQEPQAMPQLEGVRGQAIRALLLVLALAATAAVAGSLWFTGVDSFRNLPAASAFDLRIGTDPAQHRLAIDNVGARATAAGLRRGDRVLAVGERRLPDDATAFDVGAALAQAPAQALLTLARGDATVQVALVRSGDPWRRIDPAVGMPVWALAGFVFATSVAVPLFLWIAGLLQFARRPRDPETLLFAAGFFLLCFQPELTWWTDLLAPVPAVAKEAAAIAGWTACFVGLAGFPDGRFATPLARLLRAVVPQLGAGFIAWRALASGAPDGAAVTAGFTAVAALAAFAALLRYPTADLMARQQIKGAMTGFALAVLLALVFLLPGGTAILSALGMPWGFVVGRLVWLAIVLVIPLGLLVSLLRWRLYDVDAAISRSAAFALLTAALLLIFAVAERMLEALGQEYFGGSTGVIAGSAAAGLAAVLIAPLHGRATRWADERFRGPLLRLQRALPVLVSDLRETSNLYMLADAVAGRVSEGVRAARVLVVVGSEAVAERGIEREALQQWRALWRVPPEPGIAMVREDPYLPVRVPLAADGCGHVGWLLLGPRPDGSLYGRDERKVLAEIAEPVARALAIVREREAWHLTFDARIGKLETIVAGLAGSDYGGSALH